MMNMRSLLVRTWRNVCWLVVLGLWLGPAVVWGADWPQWRYDAGRSAASPAELPTELQLRWIRHLPAPQPAWPESQPNLRYDVSYSPVATGKLLLVPSMVTDSVTAYDTETGVERWRFVTDGPVRFAPIAHRGRVYVGSDDGYLYCLSADEGKLLWRFRGGPSDRKVLGNERLISTWPVRGGPVLWDNTIYFTAGIWPFMGIFLHAVDAETGEAVWTNSGDSCPFTIQPHRSPAFSGFVPQGHLAATDAGLVVPGGRTPPASYDLKTGRQVQWVWTHKGGGTCDVTARDQWYFAGGGLWQIADGMGVQLAAATVHDESGFYSLSGKELTADAFQMVEEPVAKAADKPAKTADGKADGGGQAVKITRRTLKSLWRLPIDEDYGRLFLKAGSRFYAGKMGGLTALEADPQAGKAKAVWKQTMEGTPWTMLAADDKLFVVTVEGDLYCYGGGPAASTVYERPGSQPATELHERWTRDAARILQETGVDGGYALVLGLGSGRLTEALARTPNLRVIVLDPDAQKIGDFRQRMIEAGLYGSRVTAQVSQPDEDTLPPYLASLIVSENPQAFGIDRGKGWTAIFRKLRPYGGTAYLPLTVERLNQQIRLLQLPGAEVRSSSSDAAMLIRAGGLPGASDWTQQYADGANTVVSRDDLVKAPLGLLWFGGPPNDEVLPRHGHGPSPQVAAGRLFIEGPGMLRALDIYTGRLLWQVSLPKLGKYYDNTSHQPGAGEIGSNYVSLADAVYVVYGSSILKLDAATGKQLQEIKLDATPESPAPRWGYIGAYDDLLVATSTPVNVEQDKATTKAPADPDAKAPPSPPPSIAELLLPADYASGSRRLVVLDRTTGKVLWDRQATYAFRHNNIALGAGKLFAIDGLSAMKQQVLVRRGIDPAQFPAKLLALDLRTGKEVWSTQENVLGTFLNYSAEHDILLQAGSAARDRAPDETRTGMIAYRGSDGSVVWKDLTREYSGPCMLHGDTIITQNTAYSLLNGELKMREHPLTGEPVPWEYKRNHGCNTVIASQHLLTFRSAAAGFFDLDRDGGTGNLGGFKSSCTSNLIPAGGLLNAPEYTRTCICNYQNQTSLAMVHDPNVEMWTFNDLAWSGKPIRRVGINFGAPGDRRSEDGTLWLDWPSLGGPSPDLPLEFEPKDVETFRYHSSLVRVKPESGALPWVSASGVEGIRRVELTLSKEPAPARPYTVRLHFVEPEAREAGQRVFRVRLQGQEVLAKLDIFEEAGRMTAMVKSFPVISVTDKLVVEFEPTASDTKLPPLVCGIEVVAE